MQAALDHLERLRAATTAEHTRRADLQARLYLWAGLMAAVAEQAFREFASRDPAPLQRRFGPQPSDERTVHGQ